MSRAKVAATSIGNTNVASAKTCEEPLRTVFDLSEIFLTLTASAPARIFPHETASSGRAPESEPSNSCPVFCKELSV